MFVGVVHPRSGQELLYSYVIGRDGDVLFRRNLVENEAYDYTVFAMPIRPYRGRTVTLAQRKRP